MDSKNLQMKQFAFLLMMALGGLLSAQNINVDSTIVVVEFQGSDTTEKAFWKQGKEILTGSLEPYKGMEERPFYLFLSPADMEIYMARKKYKLSSIKGAIYTFKKE